MFKPNDIVVYIGVYTKELRLIPNRIYTIFLVGDDYVYLKNESIPGIIGPYELSYFVTTTQYRKLKIEKICSKLEI
jgi:hypothetical protein